MMGMKHIRHAELSALTFQKGNKEEMAVMTSGGGGDVLWRQIAPTRSVKLVIVEGGAGRAPAKPTRRLGRAAVRRRAEAWTILVFAVVIFGTLATFAVRNVQSWIGATEQARPLTMAVTVQPGDTVWSLAKRYGDPNVYILDRVDAVARANKSVTLQRLVPGQRIYVPVTNPVEVARLQRNVAMARP